MKIIYKKGNILKTDLKVIIHGCNARGVMGAGLAKQIRTLYPEVYNSYKDIYNTEGLILGSIYWVNTNDYLFGNAITQEKYGIDSVQISYIAIQEIVQEINRVLPNLGLDKVALPKIGAGLGGGNWNTIEKIIESNLSKVQPVVYEL